MVKPARMEIVDSPVVDAFLTGLRSETTIPPWQIVTEKKGGKEKRYIESMSNGGIYLPKALMGGDVASAKTFLTTLHGRYPLNIGSFVGEYFHIPIRHEREKITLMIRTDIKNKLKKASEIKGQSMTSILEDLIHRYIK